MCAIHGYVSSLYTRAETNSQVAEYSIVYALAETAKFLAEYLHQNKILYTSPNHRQNDC